MLLKLSKILNTLAFKLRQESLYYELKHYIKVNKSYFKTIYIQERGIGKTYTLLKLSHKYKIPIIVSTRGSYTNLNNISMQHFNKPAFTLDISRLVGGKRAEMVLVDEEIGFKDVCTIYDKCDTVIGFKSDYIQDNGIQFKKEYECKWY